MTNEEKAARKALHARCRAEMAEGRRTCGKRHRYAALAWAFIRGLPFARVERMHRIQRLEHYPFRAYVHNLPDPYKLTETIAKLKGIEIRTIGPGFVGMAMGPNGNGQPIYSLNKYRDWPRELFDSVKAWLDSHRQSFTEADKIARRLAQAK